MEIKRRINITDSKVIGVFTLTQIKLVLKEIEDFKRRLEDAEEFNKGDLEEIALILDCPVDYIKDNCNIEGEEYNLGLIIMLGEKEEGFKLLEGQTKELYQEELSFLEHIKQMLISQDSIRKSDSRPTIITIQERINFLKRELGVKNE